MRKPGSIYIKSAKIVCGYVVCCLHHLHNMHIPDFHITLCTFCNNLQLQSQFDLITPIVEGMMYDMHLMASRWSKVLVSGRHASSAEAVVRGKL